MVSVSAAIDGFCTAVGVMGPCGGGSQWMGQIWLFGMVTCSLFGMFKLAPGGTGLRLEVVTGLSSCGMHFEISPSFVLCPWSSFQELKIPVVEHLICSDTVLKVLRCLNCV